MNAPLPPYVSKGAIKRALGIFNFVITSVSGAVAASATQTLAGATALTSMVNVIGAVTAAGNAVRLPALVPGQSVDIYNNGANAAAVFPAAAGVVIDAASAGASVVLSSGKRARFTCIGANVILSSQLGAPSA